MGKKKIIIAVYILGIILLRLFTPYLGKPFLIYCDGGSGNGFHLSSKVKRIYNLDVNDPCVEFVKYCTKVEKVTVNDNSGKFDIKNIANPNLNTIEFSGEGVNWSSLNKCTNLKNLIITDSNFSTYEDICELKKLETLSIYEKETDISFNKLNELTNLKELTVVCTNDIECEDISSLENLEVLILSSKGKISTRLNDMKNLKELSINCQNDIDCEDFSQLKNLEKLYLKSDGKVTGIDKLDNVTSLTISHSSQPIGTEICELDSLKEVSIGEVRLIDGALVKLVDKGVTVNFK